MLLVLVVVEVLVERGERGGVAIRFVLSHDDGRELRLSEARKVGLEFLEKHEMHHCPLVRFARMPRLRQVLAPGACARLRPACAQLAPACDRLLATALCRQGFRLVTKCSR
jgi:hypothetical protein